MPKSAQTQYRALFDLALRKSPDPESPLYQEFFTWKQGEVFTPPAHMKVEVALASGKIEEVTGG